LKNKLLNLVLVISFVFQWFITIANLAMLINIQRVNAQPTSTTWLSKGARDPSQFKLLHKQDQGHDTRCDNNRVDRQFNILIYNSLFSLFFNLWSAHRLSDIYPKPLELQLGGKGTQPHELRLAK